MNQHTVENYIQLYKTHFKRIDSDELYKWQAIKHFQTHWDINASDFASMLKLSLKKTVNLLSSGNYLARRMIIMVAKKAPEEIRSLFKMLLNESIDLQTRLENFRLSFIKLKEKHTDKKNHYQDDRALMVYLTLNYPSKYHFYKFKMLNAFTKEVSYNYRPKKGDFQNISEFQNICDTLKPFLIEDDELLKMHHDRLDSSCYQDPEYTVLTQDFIYACVNHLTTEKLEKNNILNYNIEEGLIENYKLGKLIGNLKGAKVDFEGKQRKNKKLGILGEEFIMKIEADKIKASSYASKLNLLEQVSKTEGDGLGYDIKSIDENGKEIFIEVKTTKSALSSTFYITYNELLCSVKFAKKYRLYRLYNFKPNKQTGKIKVFKGSLEGICKYPTNYHVNLKNK